METVLSRLKSVVGETESYIGKVLSISGSTALVTGRRGIQTINLAIPGFAEGDEVFVKGSQGLKKVRKESSIITYYV